MTKPNNSKKAVLSACIAVVAILFSTLLVAQEIVKSQFYRQSAFVSSIFSQDSISVKKLMEGGESLKVLQKFLTAVTDAYINFELIPLNEANTFAAVFESLNENISIERFEYHRKDLTIYGDAAGPEALQAFVEALEATRYFESISTHSYTTVDDTVRFELECSSAAATYLDFAQP